MDLICSLTGKSPSTTGAGSEGALTKSPFNALRPTIDLNNALVSYILTGLGGFSTAAGYIGPQCAWIMTSACWCRKCGADLMPPEARSGISDPQRASSNRCMISARGGEDHGQPPGISFTAKFVQTFFGRVFDNPGKVFDESILRPETQDHEAFIDGVKNITQAQSAWPRNISRMARSRTPARR